MIYVYMHMRICICTCVYKYTYVYVFVNIYIYTYWLVIPQLTIEKTPKFHHELVHEYIVIYPMLVGILDNPPIYFFVQKKTCARFIPMASLQATGLGAESSPPKLAGSSAVMGK